jgi:hypothetical protein
MTLLAVWCLTMTVGVCLQVRMAAYAGFAAATLAGVAAAWLVRRVSPHSAWLGAATAAILVLGAAAPGWPAGIAQTRRSQGPDADWAAALEWMRVNTPEPLGESAAWYREWPPIGKATRFPYPNTAYSVLASWDKGWWIAGIAHRIPTANGEANGLVYTSRILTETDPDAALRNMREIGARYVVVGSRQITSELPALITMSDRDPGQYSRIVYLPAPGAKRVPLRVFLPAYYRSIAARLYLFGGERVQAQTVRVFVTTPLATASGASEETIQLVRTFGTEGDAERWMHQQPLASAFLAGDDPARSCVDLEELPWLKQAFASRQERIQPGQQPAAVKIFELDRRS